MLSYIIDLLAVIQGEGSIIKNLQNNCDQDMELPGIGVPR